MKKIIYLLLFSFLYANDFSIKTSGNLEATFIKTKQDNNGLVEANINNDFYIYSHTKLGTSFGIYANVYNPIPVLLPL